MHLETTPSSTSLADFKVGVDTVIFSVDTEQNRLLVLLVMRHQEPFSDYWSLPGALVRVGESLEDAADRVLTEKIKVNNLYLEQQLRMVGRPAIRENQKMPMMCAIFL